MVGEAGNGGDREVDDVSSSERAGPSPTPQLRGNVGVHVGDARISERVEHNPETVPIVEGFATTIVDEINTERAGNNTQIKFETIPPIIPCENHVDNEVGVDNVVVHVEMDTDNMTREHEGPLLHGLDMVGGPSSKPTWKKRSKEQHHRPSGRAHCPGVAITGAKQPLTRNGYGGSLAILWDSCVSLNIRSFSQHHIDADVTQ